MRWVTASVIAFLLAGSAYALTPVRMQDLDTKGWRNVRDEGAKGDGKTDDTEAFANALQGRIVYVPEGTYVVRNTISWGQRKKLIGAGSGKTIIMLPDSCAGFQDPAEPKPVIWTAHPSGDYGSDSRGNAAFANYILDLTVDIGKGNPGAVGIMYTTHNRGVLGDVVVRSGDGSGSVGVDLSSTEFGPGMLRGVTVEGFDIGISTPARVSHATLIDIQLVKQNELGMLNRFPVSIHNLRSTNRVPAIRNDGAMANLALAGAHLRGGDNKSCAIEHVNGAALLLDVKTRGYKAALKNAEEVRKGASLSCTVIGTTVTLFPKTPLRAQGLVEQPPSVFVEPRGKWHVVEDSAADDTETIQKAMDSGARTVFFVPGGEYRLSETIRVGASVRRIIGFDARMEVPADDFLKEDKPAMRLEGRARKPLQVDWLELRGKYVGFEIATPRTVYFNCCSWSRYRNTPEAGKVFIDEGMGDSYFVKPAQVVVRQCDMENNPFGDGTGKLPRTYIENHGASICVFGFKTEDPAVHVVTTDGGRTEVFGGFFRDHRGPESYSWRGDPPLEGIDMSEGVPYFITRDASLSATYFHYAWAPGKARALHAIEIREGTQKEFRRAPNSLNVGLYSGGVDGGKQAEPR